MRQIRADLFVREEISATMVQKFWTRMVRSRLILVADESSEMTIARSAWSPRNLKGKSSDSDDRLPRKANFNFKTLQCVICFNVP